MAFSGDEIRATWFREEGLSGYDASQVDDLLIRVAAEVDAGRSPEPLIRNAAFRTTTDPLNRNAAFSTTTEQSSRYLRAPQYERSAVDWFLGELSRSPAGHDAAATGFDPWRDLGLVAQLTRTRRPDPAERRGFRQWFTTDWDRISAEFEGAWHDFGQLPGARLRWKIAWRPLRRELIAADHEIMAVGLSKLVVRGRSYQVREARPADFADSAVAQVAERSSRDDAGQFAYARTRLRSQRHHIKVITDESGMPVLHASGDSYQMHTWARVTFADQRSLRFLVRGSRRRNAIMTAVDQSGNSAARYRQAGGCVEIVVNPRWQLSDELILAVTQSADWLSGYFNMGH
jgi:DivIVA domain-containing protein